MKTMRIFVPVCLVMLVCSVLGASAADPEFPAYILKAQSLIAEADAKAVELNNYADEVQFARNYLKNAESEYRKNLSWGTLDPKVEPTVRYLADMARLQASVVLSRAGTIAQEKERLRLEGVAAEVKARIKVFDDKLAEIALLKAEMVKRDGVSKEEVSKRDTTIKDLDGQLAARKIEIEQLNAKVAGLSADVAAKTSSLLTSESMGGSTFKELDTQKKASAVLEKKVSDLMAAMESAKAENVKLRGDLAAIALQKGAAESQSREQIETLNRQKDFVAEVGKLGGVIKSGSDNMTVIFARSSMLKAPKNDALTTDGDRMIVQVTDLLKRYPEFRLKIKVHGFGQGKAEDASATDRMARLIRETLVEQGTLEPAVVEALGAGSVEPVYPKNNPEGNRRVEVTFVKR